MRFGVRLSVATLATTMVAIMPLAALADDRASDRTIDQVTDRIESDRPADGAEGPVEDRATDRVVDVVEDRTADRVVDVVEDRRRDAPTDVRPVTDRPDSRIDREVDRVTDRCHPRIVDNVRRCVSDDRPHDFNVRHLIWRLIKAHEWEKLIRLLHWLGWL